MTGIDLHTHTVFDHGANTPEEMVKKALELKMDCIGLCIHAHDLSDEDWTASPEGMKNFRAEVERLKEQYGPKIWILCGVEMDYYSDVPAEGFDYVIGSVHWLDYDGELRSVDQSGEALLETANRFANGDVLSVVEKYYDTVSKVLKKTHADVIGHFDLITKFNENGELFDVNDPRYKAAWQKAADRLLKSGKPFEINTGAMSRGYRTLPYPSKEIRDYIHEKGGYLLLSSDAHDRENLMHRFEAYEQETDPEAYDFLQEL